MKWEGNEYVVDVEVEAIHRRPGFAADIHDQKADSRERGSAFCLVDGPADSTNAMKPSAPKIALHQANPLIADVVGAMRSIRTAAVQAAAAGATLMVCPELAAIGGYPPRDLLERRYLVEAQWQAVNELAKDLPLPVVLGCVEPLEPGLGPDIANAVAVLDGGQVTATYHKRLLPTYDVFDERRYFRPGMTPAVVTIAGLRVGLTVCEDIWNEAFVGGSLGLGLRYHQDPVGDLAGQCDLIVNCSASPYHLGKSATRRRVVGAAARRARCPIAYANQVGGQDELLFDGDSGVALTDGRWLAGLGRWQEGVAIIDLAGTPQVEFPQPVEADLHAALVAGIRDYCRKTGQTKVVLGLSGGIDSALVAALAVDALGPDAVTGLLMPGPYSSAGSVNDAVALAEALGLRHHILGISEANRLMLGTLEPVFVGTPFGLAEENLQSRLRGVLVMAVANKLGAMALTTGNKSELATGYCTIYGDMNGGLAPIGDLYKTRIWALSRHLNAVAGRERIPVASIDKAPSAELRENQTDQDSLPPYDELDRILTGFLEAGLSPDELITRGEDPATVRRIIRLVEVTEFKRRQSAPVLRVSTKAFGVGRRIPIARKF